MSFLDHRVPPPIVMTLTGLAMGGAALALGESEFGLVWRLAAAAPFFFAAGYFGPSAIRTFLRLGTTIDPVNIERAGRLVTSGVFARTRNPMYVSMVLLLTSLALALGQPVLLVGPVLFVLYITRFQIMPEERILTERFGSDYQDYQRRVRRWI